MNMLLWKKKSEIKRLKQFIKDFNLFIKQCYVTVWSKEGKKSTESKKRKVKKIKNRRAMLSSNCTVFHSKEIKIY